MLTFLPLEQIDEMDSWEGSKLNEAKDILAYELTKLVHGEEEADRAREASKALFGGGNSMENVPAVVIPQESLTEEGIDILQAMVIGEMVATRSEARRAVEQGGVSADGEKVTDIKMMLSLDKLSEGVLVKKGKKIYKKITR